MRLCVGMPYRENDPWLRLHLEVYTRGSIDGFVFLDTGETETSADQVRGIMQAAGYADGDTFDLDEDAKKFHIVTRPFDWDMGGQQNALIEACEALDYDAMFKADPDELLWPGHFAQIKALLADHALLSFPRFGFMGDRLHYVSTKPYWPDFQHRAWRLGEGVRYLPQRTHAPLNIRELGLRHKNHLGQAGSFGWLLVPHIPIYHYGEIAPRRHRTWWVWNYERIAMGGEPLPYEEFPDTIPTLEMPARIRFAGPQPLDPNVVGMRAPFEEPPLMWRAQAGKRFSRLESEFELAQRKKGAR